MPERTNLRPTRSRKDRPCDRCRRQKHTCRIIIRGQPCASCAKAHKECTFSGPPVIRHRHSSTRDAASSLTPLRSESPTKFLSETISGDSHDVSYRRPSVMPVPWNETSTWSRKGKERLVTNSRGRALDFVESLDEEERSRESSTDNDVEYPSLDLEVTDQEESHYLGSIAFSHLTLDPPSTGVATSPVGSSPSTGGISYRQVADPRRPVFFLRNPSKVYGLANNAYAAERAYEAVTEVLRAEHPEYPARLLQMFMNKTLPAFPILNKVRLEATCFAWQGAGPFPHTVLVGILAHSAVYIPSLRHKCKDLFGISLHLLENEYRQPRLQTLQLAMLDIFGRPMIDPGGNHTAICRAMGAAQLLGLHRNSARWRLPRWERSVRKRIWWTLFIADKWNAFVYGRPSNLPSGNSTVPVPTLEDDDWKGQGEESGAMTSFVAMCRLSTILDSLLPLLAVSDRDEEVPHPKGILRDAAETLGEIDEGLPDLSFEGGYQGPGIRSFQLCHLGIALLICRIGVDLQTQMTQSQLIRSMEHALGLVEDVIRFLEGLTSEDYASFWVPWASFQISHATALLLRTAMRLHRDGSTLTKLLDTAWTLLNRLVKAVERGVDSAWEVAEVAYPKVKALVNSLPNIPGSEGVKSRLAPPPDLGGVTQAAEPPLDLSTFLNQSEWVTADTALWIRDFTQTFMTET